MRMHRGIIALGLALVLGAACSKDQSFVVVEVVSSGAPISFCQQFLVDVHNGGFDDVLTYPAEGSPEATKDYVVASSPPVTMSLRFPTTFLGELEVAVTARNSAGIDLAYGMTTVTIDPGHVTRARVVIDPSRMRPRNGLRRTDAGAGDARATDAAVPCDPVSATACGPGMSCGLGCGAGGMMPETMCRMAGATPTGSACTARGECLPGAECLTESCGVSSCQALCHGDADCAAVTGSRCLSTVISCGAASTGVRLCSQPCDPRGAATTGCAAGLGCFIFENEITSCDCAGPMRVKNDGESCAMSGECMPGLLCVNMAPSTVCRPVCRLGSTTDCAAGRVCEPLTQPVFTTWGACVPQ